jgi:hypothetical protein
MHQFKGFLDTKVPYLFLLEDVNNGPQETQDELDIVNEGRWEQMKCLIKVDANLDHDKANEFWQVVISMLMFLHGTREN